MANLVRSAVSLVAIIFIMITTVDATASTIAEPPSSCPDIISSVIDCLSYIANGSIVDRPSKACCIGIASVIKGSTTVCLCKSLKEALSYDVPINMTRVLGLPVACSVKAAKIDCSDADSPSPSLSPLPSSPSPTPSSLLPSPSTPSPAASQVLAPTPSPAASQTPHSSEAPKLNAPLVAMADLLVAYFIMFFLLF